MYEQWGFHLRVVYGSEVGSEGLYLPVSTWLRLPIFRECSIINFIEEDLFCWVHRINEGFEAEQLLASSFSSYNLIISLKK
ncbi:MAG: hypothetical protein QXW50_03915 [Nitrososphaerota archaeon]